MSKFDELCRWAEELDAISFAVRGAGDGFDLLLIAKPKRAVGGLYVHVGGSLSKSQKEWVSKLILAGYQVEVSLTIAAAKAVITTYLS
jgi:hypothetical protein